MARDQKGEKESEVRVDLLLYFDEETGFSAVDQGTDQPPAIITISRKEVAEGVIAVEEAMSGESSRAHAEQRGIDVLLAIMPL